MHKVFKRVHPRQGSNATKRLVISGYGRTRKKKKTLLKRRKNGSVNQSDSNSIYIFEDESGLERGFQKREKKQLTYNLRLHVTNATVNS